MDSTFDKGAGVNQNVLHMQSRDLLRQAAEWRLLALLFECPVPGWREQVAALSREIKDEALAAAGKRALDEASEGLYHSIFGPGGPVPAREAGWHDSVQLGTLMSELAAYYAAFAYRPATSEVADHISVEIGFVAYLRLKQAYALECSNEENAAVTSQAARSFIDNHLSCVAQPVAAALRGRGVDYLASAAELLLMRARPTAKTKAPSHQAGPAFMNCPQEDGEIQCGGVCPSGQ
jgi:nitrate reductase assembly molybdenum cofactor insertion protein NarJ